MYIFSLTGRPLVAACFIMIFSLDLFGAQQPVRFSGVILDMLTHQPVINATVKVLNQTITSDKKGQFAFQGTDNKPFEILISHESYHSTTQEIDHKTYAQQKIVILLKPKIYRTDPILVTAKHTHNKLEHIAEKSNVLEGKDLEKKLSSNLASTLKNETGIAMRSMGPAPARPVLRGLGSDRVLISEDGQTTVDLSTTSPDHAVTIDPFSSERIEVIRGPKILLQTSTTIGGVINVVRHDIPQSLKDAITGNFGLYGESANSGYLGSAQAEIPLKPFAIKGMVSRRKTDDLQTPKTKLQNSQSENFSAIAGASWIGDLGFVGSSLKHFSLDYGIPGGFVGAHPNGVFIEMKKDQMDIKSRLYSDGGLFSSIETHLSFSDYYHKEIESNGSVGAEFKILNYQGFVHFNHLKSGIFNQGTLGLSFHVRNFDIGGNVFTSPSLSKNASLYVFESIVLNRLTLEFGGRLNYDVITPDKEKPDANIGFVRERDFFTTAFSASLLYELTKNWSIGGNLSQSSRVPSIEELYSEGPHLAAYSYEVGNPDLNSEFGLGAELFNYVESENFNLLATFFWYDLNTFIVPRNTGEFNYRLLLPIYQTVGEPAQLFGGEFNFNLSISKKLGFTTSASYTQGEFSNRNHALPLIPPLKGTFGLNGHIDDFDWDIEWVWAASQNRTDEFEESTEGYAILNASVLYSFMTGSQVHNLSFTVENLFNTEYRNHLSRVKSIMPEAGTNVRLTYKIYY